MNRFLGIVSMAACVAAPAGAAEMRGADAIVYGGASAGVIAAVQAVKMGRTAILVCPDRHLGGLSSGGIGWTDTGNKATIGGLSREFYPRVWKRYDRDATWRRQTREAYGNKYVKLRARLPADGQVLELPRPAHADAADGPCRQVSSVAATVGRGRQALRCAATADRKGAL
jgi:hypothetical protein